MTKEIKIETPKGYIVDENKSTWNKIVFKKVNYCVDVYGKIFSSVIDRDTPHSYPTRELAEASIALATLLRLRNEVWGDWAPDWKSVTKKHVIYIFNETIMKEARSYTQHLLTFKSEEERDSFCKSYKYLIEQAKELL